MTLDQAVLDWFVSIREPWSTVLMFAVTHTGGMVGTHLTAALVAVLLVRSGRRGEACLVVGAVVSAWPVMSLLKIAFGRDRPPEPDRLVVSSTEAFPSGHAMTSAVLATVLVVLALRTWTSGRPRRVAVTAAVVYTTAVGLSRVYLAAHWLTDVLAGWVLGVGWALSWVWLITRWPGVGTEERPPPRPAEAGVLTRSEQTGLGSATTSARRAPLHQGERRSE